MDQRKSGPLPDVASPSPKPDGKPGRAIAAVVGVILLLAVLAAVAGSQNKRARMDAARREDEARIRQDEDRMRREAERDRARRPYAELVENAARGGETTPGLAAALASQRLDGFVPERTSPDVHDFVSGTAAWEGRRLPAARGKAMLPMVNRAAGRKGWLCVLFAAIDDQEFKMWRSVETRRCEEQGADASMAEWARTWGFRPE